jgi:simple sugar transport system permease protein
MKQKLVTPVYLVCTLLIALFLAAGVIAISGEDPWLSFQALLTGAFGDMSALSETMIKATPLAISGLAVALGLRAGLFNIGVEGQLLVGGIASAWLGQAVRLPAVVHIPACLAIGFLTGALWGLLPGFLKARRGVHEVITTIMMNYIALCLTHYLVLNSLKDPYTMSPQTSPIYPSARLPQIAELGNIHFGVLLALGLIFIHALFVSRTVWGYEMTIVGSSPNAARSAGINVPKILVLVMLLSGGIAGVSGAVEVMGVHHKFYDQFSPGYGFDSIAVALLGNASSLGTGLSAILFGALRNGAVSMQLVTDTPKEIVTIIQAIVIIFAGARFLRQHQSSK